MAPTKAEALKQMPPRSDQKALVKKIMGTRTVKPIKYVIAGGKTLVEDLDASDIKKAVYTWLCHHRHWTSAIISFAKEPQMMNTRETRVIDFDAKTPVPHWEQHGKRPLGIMVGDVINNTDKLVAVKIEKEGIYTLTSDDNLEPGSEDWEPYIELTPFRPPVF